MTLSKAILSTCLAFISLLLSSCIDGREEIWLNADGSDRARLTYDVPATAAKFHGGVEGVSEMLDTLLKAFPGASRKVTIDGDRLNVDVDLKFASAESLSTLRKSTGEKSVPQALRHLAGVFEVKRELRDVELTRTISPGLALPTAFIPPSELRNRKLTYILHLPMVPTETSADRTENGGLTQIWEQPLASAIRKPMVIHVKAKIPVPGWLAATAVGAIALLIMAITLTLAARRRSRMAQAPA